MAAFISPSVSLDSMNESSIRSLPELVDFHGRRNPQHLFCLQAEKDNRVVSVSFEKLKQAIVRCQDWLHEQTIGLHAPVVDANGLVRKCEPVAILMDSHIGLALYVLACMGIGIPTVLLSARLSAPAVRHLVQSTGAKTLLVSPRLQSLASEALVAVKRDDGEENTRETEVTARVVARYETLLGGVERAHPTTTIAHSNHFISEDDRQVLILHSSGTSGMPKPIPCTHRYFLGYGTCHTFNSEEEAHGLTLSTLPLFHGFGFLSICMSLCIGKTVCIPPSVMIPNGPSIGALLENSGAKVLLTVPSILEEIESLPCSKGHEVLRKLDFVAIGGGVLSLSTGERLVSAGVRLISQYGATETGPLTPLYVPSPGHDWRQLRLRSEILEPLQVKLDRNEVDIDQPTKLPPSLVDSHSEQTHTYMLSMKPFGWRERFELQDLIVTRKDLTSSTDIGQIYFTIAGRVDDLICLATGEKVRPTILESLLRQQKGVKEATVFGDQQLELGVIVEPDKVVGPDEVENFKASIWPAVEEACLQMDAHARIMSPAAILIVNPGTLPKSDKGSILRKAVAVKFAEEIADVYHGLSTSADAPLLDILSPQSTIRTLVEQKVKLQVSGVDWLDDDDFFTLGMDSLQATRLRRLLVASVRATHAAPEFYEGSVLPVEKITDDFVYRYPSVNMLVKALIPRQSMTNGVTPESELIEKLVEQYSGKVGKQQPLVKVVALTGATGSLGSFFLEQLLRDDFVDRVICFNRPRKEDPFEIQRKAMVSRDISISDDMWAKIEIYQTNTAAPFLGLENQDYERLVSAVTHVVHMAWPMNFKMGLQSFDASFKSLKNLIQLARRASFHHDGGKPRFLFVSSISTVGNYPLINGVPLVPEIIVEDPTCTLELGYAKAKLVCEKITQHATRNFPEIEAGLVRVGQVAGASNGYWNANEHFAAICASSQKLAMFPSLKGTLSWLPVDSAAKAIAEIMFNDRPLRPVYHLENPVRQHWEDITKLISNELKIPDSSIVPLDRWLKNVASAPQSGNPAASLIDFLRTDFLKMSCGSVVLDTSSTRDVSPTVATTGTIAEDTIRAYLNYWKRIKLLE